MEPICKVDLACPAEDHHPSCPWHPNNIEHMAVTADDWDLLERELAAAPKEKPRLAELMKERSTVFDTDELLPAEETEVEKLVSLRRAGITFANQASTLMMRYNFNRWELIMKEVGRRLKENRSEE
jgi:hypothetical protein